MNRRNWIRHATACLAWALLLCVGGQGTAAVPIYSGNRVLFAGDSITAQGYPTASGGVVDLATASLVPYSGRYYATSTGIQCRSTGTQATQGGPVQVPRGAFPHGALGTIYNSGVSGQRSADMAAAVSAQITSYAADVIIILIGTNDVSAATDPAVFGSTVQSIVTQIRAVQPTTPIGLVSVLAYGDSWTAGPPVAFLSEGVDSLILSYNAQLQIIAANNAGVTYIPARDGMLAWEVANNAPAPGTEGVLFNERHPTIPLGQVQLGTAMAPSFVARP
jgi:lysophospholipase L1-like esterase